MKHTQTIISGLFILLFTYTALSKLTHLKRFASVLGKIPFMEHMPGVLSVAIPVAELIIAAMLFFPGTRNKGMYAAFIMMILFTGSITYMVLFMPGLPCSCGGVLQQMTWTQHIYFNLFFTALAAFAIRYQFVATKRLHVQQARVS